MKPPEQTRNLDVMRDASEVVHYVRPDLPLRISSGRLTDFPGRRALCHWHDDLELIRVCTGSMRYRIGGDTVLLRAGDCIFVNTRQLHYGFAGDDPDCTFLCILFHPSLLAESRALYHDYVLPVLENDALSALHLIPGTAAGDTAAALLDRISALKETAAPGYELAAIGALHTLWHALLPLCTPAEAGAESSDVTAQKDMVSFIQRHYAEKLTLGDIAAAGHVCQNKCCVLFRQYMQQSPVDFLNAYRLEVSRHLLETTDASVTKIALACGFNHPSYFAKCFARKYGVPPRRMRCTAASARQ